jgi:formylglycine-generating enzyme required for sulfatase activity
MTSKPTEQSQQQSPDSKTDRSNIIGLTLLAIMIAFVAYWMAMQDTGEGSAANVDRPTIEIPGFDASLWYLPDDALSGFVAIPAGAFLMGSDPAVDRQAYENERWSQTQRQGRLELEQFYLSRFEVTVAQYQAFVASTNHPIVTQTLSSPPDHPVSNITWTDALAYCRWLESVLIESSTASSGLKNLLSNGWQISLPTEAQWEKAARGTRGFIYPWGNQLLQDRANFSNDATVAVGSIDCPECNFGLSDMSGNVWELTRSPYQDYPFNNDDDGANLADDALWIMRGGSYSDGPENVRAAVRGGVDPGVRSSTIGFRLALSRI